MATVKNSNEMMIVASTGRENVDRKTITTKNAVAITVPVAVAQLKNTERIIKIEKRFIQVGEQWLFSHLHRKAAHFPSCNFRFSIWFVTLWFRLLWSVGRMVEWFGSVCFSARPVRLIFHRK